MYPGSGSPILEPQLPRGDWRQPEVRTWKARKEGLAFLQAGPAHGPGLLLVLIGTLWTFSSFLVYLSSGYQQQNHRDEDKYRCQRKQAKGRCLKVQRGLV